MPKGMGYSNKSDKMNKEKKEGIKKKLSGVKRSRRASGK